jgi:exosortase/archaeosortase family protein
VLADLLALDADVATPKKKGTQESRTGRLLSPLLGLRYPLVVAAIAAPLFALYAYPYADTSAMVASMQSYLAAYAKMVGAVISLFDPNITVNGNRIVGKIFSMSIVKTCDAMEVNILLAAALAGFPMPLRRRLVAVLAACVALVALNVLRLCVLYWLGVHTPAWFERAHQVLAPFAMVACALAIFLIATLGARRRACERPANAVTASP